MYTCIGLCSRPIYTSECSRTFGCVRVCECVTHTYIHAYIHGSVHQYTCKSRHWREYIWAMRTGVGTCVL